MRLTKKKAIEIAKELWTWLAETGRAKEEWPGWEQYGKMESSCALCEYGCQHGSMTCKPCPYYQKFGGCIAEDAPYFQWAGAQNLQDRKKYARQFLEQVKQLET
jgi:hypothetical protein